MQQECSTRSEKDGTGNGNRISSHPQLFIKRFGYGPAILVGLILLKYIVAPFVTITLPVNRPLAPQATKPDLDRDAWRNQVRAFVARPNVSATDAETFYQEIGYDLETVRWWNEPVPRLFLTGMPTGLGELTPVARKKSVFVRSVLPLILLVNEEVLTLRREVADMRWKVRSGQALSMEEAVRMTRLAEQFGSKRSAQLPERLLDDLLQRIDAVPPGLALAQSAEESGWGTSRFVREGNALFGQWTWDAGAGIVPAKRAEGKTHTVRAFSSLADSVRAYVFNLNTSRHYISFRVARARSRRIGGDVSGTHLAGFLGSYSERGDEYIRDIRNLIRINSFDSLNHANLAREVPTPAGS